MKTVTITDAALSIEDLLAVVDGAPVELAASARTLSRARTRFKGIRTPFRVIMQLVGTHR